MKFGKLEGRDYDNLLMTDAVLAFHVAINGSLVQFPLLDSVVDEYEDESGVDNVNSINELYTANDDCYSPVLLQGGIDSNTNLMIHANGGDESGQDHIPTYSGNSKIDGSTYKFGKGALYLDGTGDYVTIPDNDDWTWTGDFTVDCWVRFDTLSGYQYLITSGQDATGFFRIRWDGPASEWGCGLIDTLVTGSDSLSIDTWYHLAFVRSGSTATVYRDGVSKGSNTRAGTVNSGNGLIIGAYSGGGQLFLTGYIDGLRITKGEALWTTGFTPPTSAPTAGVNTKLLFNFEGGDQYGGNNVEPQGTAQIDRTTKKWGTGAWKFDGNSDSLELPDSADWDIVGSNSDNWTVDFWVKHTDHVGDEDYIGQWEDGSNYWKMVHTHGSGIRFIASSGSLIIDTGYGGEITDTDWHHVALCKVADEYAIYKDGTQVNYTQDTSIDTYSGGLDIGFGFSANYFDGNMDEIRVQHSNYFSASPVVGLTDTITIPTTEYTTSTGALAMTLISNATTADSTPDEGRLVVLMEEVDSITLNTDLKAYVTRDGGSTYGQVTLTDEGYFDANNTIKVLAGTVDLTQSGIGSGTSVEYKMTTHNAKDLKLHATSTMWR